MIRNKVRVCFYGNTQADGDAGAHWDPINFQIYSNLFPELIEEAIDQWLADNTVLPNCAHEVIFSHIVERDSAGAVTGEYFEPIWHESQNW